MALKKVKKAVGKIAKKRDELATKAGKAIKRKTDQIKKNPEKTALGVAASEAGIVAARKIAGRAAAMAAGGLGGAASLGFMVGSAIESATGVGKKLGSAKFDAEQKIRKQKIREIQQRRVKKVAKARKAARKTK